MKIAVLLFTLMSLNAWSMPTGAFNPAPYIRMQQIQVTSNVYKAALQHMYEFAKIGRVHPQHLEDLKQILATEEFEPIALSSPERIKKLGSAEAELAEAELAEAGITGYKFLEHSEMRFSWFVRVGPYVLLRSGDSWEVHGIRDEQIEDYMFRDLIAKSLIHPPRLQIHEAQLYNLETKAALKKFAEILKWRGFMGSDCAEYLELQKQLPPPLPE